MKTLMLMSFFMMTPEGMMPAGNDSAQFNSLDECIYQLVSVQQLNSRQQFVVAGCIDLGTPADNSEVDN